MSRQDALLDFRMADGSRHFAEAPWRQARALRRRLGATPGATVTAFVDGAAESWIEFEYAGHAFGAHNPLNDYWLFVHDPACPEAVLRDVVRRLA